MRILRIPLLISALTVAPHLVASASAMPPPPPTPTFTLTAVPLCQADVLRLSFRISADASTRMWSCRLAGRPSPLRSS